jgi:hypothetical protein
VKGTSVGYLVLEVGRTSRYNLDEDETRKIELNDGPGKNMPKFRYNLSIIALLFLAGCQAESFKAKERICRQDIQRQELMSLAEDVLADMYFTIDKSDIKHGLLRTKPLPGAQSFEIWRSDNIGQYNSDFANLHSIVRTAELTFSRDNQQVCLDCNVKIHRLSLPERDAHNSARIYRIFFDGTGALEQLELSGKQKEQMAWIDMGRDNRLETEILNRIETRIQRLKR